MHALVCDLMPGGITKEVVVTQAGELLDEHHRHVAGRCSAMYWLARDLLADVEALDAATPPVQSPHRGGSGRVGDNPDGDLRRW